VLDAARREPGVPSVLIYIDEGATSWPKAPGVAEAVTSALTTPPVLRDGEEPGQRGPMWECREMLARLLNVPCPERIFLTSGATHALNIALFGLGRYRGSRVVTSCAEHESVLRPLCHLRDCRRIQLTIVGLDATGDINYESFASAVGGGSTLVVLTHASNVTGRVFDVASLFALARSAGAYTLLDAAQTLGQIPVHPDALRADMVAFTGHKRLRGPSGTGGLYVDPRLVLSPIFMSTSRSRTGLVMHTPPELPAGFDTGRPDMSAFAGLCAALRWQEREGELCRREGRRLARLLRRGLRRIRGVRIVGDAKRAERVPIISIRIAGRQTEDVRDELEARFGIRCSAGLHAAPLIHKALGTRPEGTIRLGVSGFNTEDEIKHTLSAIRFVTTRRPAPAGG